VDSEEAVWNTGRDEMPNLGYKIRHKEGYFPVGPTDTQQDIRTEMVLVMEELGIKVERQHHEVATAGQAEIDFRFDTLVKTADTMMLYKYIIKNVAKKHGKTVTFMPKPLFGDNGSGMHTHQSLWKKGKPLFAGNEYAGLSQMALYYIGGILKHAKALCAICNPTVNSYKRLVPGYEAPVNLAYSARNRSAAIRIPTFSESPQGQAHRVSSPGSRGQPVPLLHGAADGGPRRRAQQNRSRRADGQEPVRAAARGTGQGAADAREPGRALTAPGGGSRLPAQGGRVHQGLPGDVD
jgi:glutamine synthetase